LRAAAAPGRADLITVGGRILKLRDEARPSRKVVTAKPSAGRDAKWASSANPRRAIDFVRNVYDFVHAGVTNPGNES
jgi:hypothetical protein